MPELPPPTVTLLDWDESGLSLLRGLNTPEQKRHLGGPETEEKLLDRHARYLTYSKPGDRMMRIAANGEIAGAIGYWEIERQGRKAYETGWEILPEWHGRGVATAAARLLIDLLRQEVGEEVLYAFPAPDNLASNALCRKLGFAFVGVSDFEYPKGVVSPHNVWRRDLKPLNSLPQSA